MTAAEVQLRAHLFKPQSAFFAKQAAEGRAGCPVRLTGPASARALQQMTAEKPNAFVARVARGPDQNEQLVLQVAEKVGRSALGAVDQALRGGGSVAFANAFAVLDAHLGDRELYVDVDQIGAGVHEELKQAFRGVSEKVRSWLASRASGLGGRPIALALFGDNFDFTNVPVEPVDSKEWDTQDLWKRARGNPNRYTLAVARVRLGILRDADDFAPASLVDDVYTALPRRERALIEVLAVHGRAIGRELAIRAAESVTRLDLSDAFETLLDLGLIEETSGEVALLQPFYVNQNVFVVAPKRRSLHGQLASFFAGHSIGADQAAADPLMALEAHRHFAAIPDIERAAEFVRYSTATLLEAARHLSLHEEYPRSATAYDAIIRLDDKLKPVGIGARPRAYARHYLHYNRYRADLETLTETLNGYARALDDWPENALFWSRRIAGLFIAGAEKEAMDALANARSSVPPHPERERVLIGRTTEKLLQRDQPLSAALVWNDYVAPVGDRVIALALSRRLARGIETNRIWVPDQAMIVFHAAQRVVVNQADGTWIGSVLGISSRGPSLVAVLTGLVRDLRARTRILLTTPTHTLTPEERLEKRLLLGAVDVLASAIADADSDEAWVLGRLRHATATAGASVTVEFHTPDGRRFAVHPGGGATLTEEAFYRLARVKFRHHGELDGDVIELGDPLGANVEQSWHAWIERMKLHG